MLSLGNCLCAAEAPHEKNCTDDTEKNGYCLEILSEESWDFGCSSEGSFSVCKYALFFSKKQYRFSNIGQIILYTDTIFGI